MRVSDIAAFLEASFEGDGEHEIRGVSTLESARPDEIAFVGNAKAVRAAADSQAGCLLVPQGFPGGQRRRRLRSATDTAYNVELRSACCCGPLAQVAELVDALP